MQSKLRLRGLEKAMILVLLLSKSTVLCQLTVSYFAVSFVKSYYTHATTSDIFLTFRISGDGNVYTIWSYNSEALVIGVGGDGKKLVVTAGSDSCTAAGIF
jgi:hypothetical protein